MEKVTKKYECTCGWKVDVNGTITEQNECSLEALNHADEGHIIHSYTLLPSGHVRRLRVMPKEMYAHIGNVNEYTKHQKELTLRVQKRGKKVPTAGLVSRSRIYKDMIAEGIEEDRANMILQEII